MDNQLKRHGPEDPPAFLVVDVSAGWGQAIIPDEYGAGPGDTVFLYVRGAWFRPGNRPAPTTILLGLNPDDAWDLQGLLGRLRNERN